MLNSLVLDAKGRSVLRVDRQSRKHTIDKKCGIISLDPWKTQKKKKEKKSLSHPFTFTSRRADETLVVPRNANKAAFEAIYPLINLLSP